MSDMSIEERALGTFAVYFETQQEGSRYMNRWAKLQADVLDKDVFAVNNTLRLACIEMYKAGFMLRLTGE